MATTTTQPASPAWPPRGLTGWLLRRHLPPDTDPASADGRTRLGFLQGIISVILNALLFLIKGILGFLFGSVALLADAIHSLADCGSSLVIVIGSLWARKPRDSKHPFGHGRIELVTALVMAILLIVMAVEFARLGVDRLFHPSQYTAPLWAIALVALTLVAKHWLTRFSHRLAAATGSSALQADYWHHFADLLSTLLVVLALIASRYNWPAVDAWAGIGIAGFLLYTGIHTALNAISPLLGEAPTPEEIARIETAARAIPGVRGVHDLILHRYGEFRLVSLHIEVDADRSAMDTHDTAEAVEAAVEKLMGGRAIVHVDPVDRTHPSYPATETAMQHIVADQPRLTEFHDLRITGPTHRLSLSVDVVAVVGTREADYAEIEQRVRAALQHAMPDIAEISISVETGFHGKAAEPQP
jgi:cation diffusion facilitator family transporter